MGILNVLKSVASGLKKVGANVYQRLLRRQRQQPQHSFNGFCIGPIGFTVVRIGTSLVAGFIIVSMLAMTESFLVQQIFGSSGNFSIFNAGTNLLFTLLFAVVFALPDQPEGNQEKVPPGYAAMITFIGIPLRVYRINGNYPWTGRRLGLDRTRVDRKPFTNAEQFIFLEKVPVRIWNQAASEETKDPVLSSIASDGSTIKANLTISLKLFDPKLWINTEDPLLLVAERARASFRTAISFFTGRDNASVKSVLSKLMMGIEVVTCFLQKNVGGHKEGSVVRDRADVAIYEEVPLSLTTAEQSMGSEEQRNSRISRAEAKLTERIDSRSSHEMRKVIKDDDGSYHIELRSVEEDLSYVLDSVGVAAENVSISDVAYSGTVEEEANKAAGEEFQAIARRASANSTAEAQGILGKAQKNTPVDDMARAVAAMQDNPDSVRLVFVPGADNLTKAAVAGASQIGNQGKDKK